MEDRCFFMEEWECLEGLGWVWVVYRLEIYFILFNINNFNNSCIFKDVLDKCRLWRVWWEGRVSVDSIWVWCLICSGYSYYIMLLYYELLIMWFCLLKLCLIYSELTILYGNYGLGILGIMFMYCLSGFGFFIMFFMGDICLGRFWEYNCCWNCWYWVV